MCVASGKEGKVPFEEGGNKERKSLLSVEGICRIEGVARVVDTAQEEQ